VTLFTIFVIEVFLMRCPYRRFAANQNVHTSEALIPGPIHNVKMLRLKDEVTNVSHFTFDFDWNENNKTDSSGILKTSINIPRNRTKRDGPVFSWFSFSPGKTQNKSTTLSDDDSVRKSTRMGNIGVNSFGPDTPPVQPG